MNTDKIAELTLDEATIRYRNPEIAHEREMAITDLLHHNAFRPLNMKESGPYKLHISAVDQRLFMSVKPVEEEAEDYTIILSMRGFRKVIKDYFLIWEAYSAGLSTHTPEKLQALDMGRRAVHDEGAELLKTSLRQEVELDFDTARRIFTLICILHIK